jgi:nucleotide-binding universal stress UspA family protein
LLALDDSPAGEIALLFAGALARRTSASVHVLHVNERIVAGNGTTLRTRAEASELVTNAVRQLAAVDVRADGSACVASYREVPARIVAKAVDVSADGIVLGSIRNRRWGRMFAAQVRERTTRLTSLPVLTAPSPLRITALPGTGSWEGRVDQALDSLIR